MLIVSMVWYVHINNELYHEYHMKQLEHENK